MVLLSPYLLKTSVKPKLTSKCPRPSQAANIAAAFRRVGALSAERCIPTAVLRGAAGFAILSIAKVSKGMTTDSWLH
jgi:hypothetical protein